MKDVWIVGEPHAEHGWTLGGIFSSEALAAAACRKPTEFVAGPFPIDVLGPDEDTPMPNAHYPLKGSDE